MQADDPGGSLPLPTQVRSHGPARPMGIRTGDRDAESRSSREPGRNARREASRRS